MDPLYLKGEHRCVCMCTNYVSWIDSFLQDLEDVLRLDGAVASLCDVDDRRYVFQIVSRSELK